MSMKQRRGHMSAYSDIRKEKNDSEKGDERGVSVLTLSLQSNFRIGQKTFRSPSRTFSHTCTTVCVFLSCRIRIFLFPTLRKMSVSCRCWYLMGWGVCRAAWAWLLRSLL